MVRRLKSEMKGWDGSDLFPQRQLEAIPVDYPQAEDDVVLAHLNHRLVQMCLRLLRAEVWSKEGRKALHQVTARFVPNSVLDTPAVIAYGRLVILGSDQQRLHEEVIMAGGLLKEGKFSRLGVMKIQEAVSVALPELAPENYLFNSPKASTVSITVNIITKLTCGNMFKTHSFAILAPVPEMHLLSAMEIIANLEHELSDETVKTAFGSMDFELFRKVDELRGDKSVEVLIYASHSDADQPLDSEASWHGLYIGHVNSRNGRYPGKAKFRPPSTATDKPTWASFWEVQDLKPLTSPIKIGFLKGLGKKSYYNSRFIPEGPLLIECP